NHSNHHRGELAAMLALLNVPHPEDDMLYYFREGARSPAG
ncbi:MAG: damage-inducible protein DinB, partial [Chloroflexi bacterium]|nr:damage-inducible protein DinB [Chloroflexota bacterium]